MHAIMKALLLLLVILAHHYCADGFESNTIICLYKEECSSQRCSVAYTDIFNVTFPKGNFTVQFCSSEFQLNGVLKIANSHSVIIAGMPTQIMCEKESNTGINMHEVTGLVLQDIELVSCGAVFNISSPHSIRNAVIFTSSIYIKNCSDVTIERLTITSSQGDGATLFDNIGTILIQNSTFQLSNYNNSRDEDTYLGGSGLHIQLSYCGPRSSNGGKCATKHARNITDSSYYIKGCNFSMNAAVNGSGYKANSVSSKKRVLLSEGFGRGGGLCIILDQYSSSNLVHVADCNFTENQATWGGGLYLAIQEGSRDNSIEVERCNFYRNKCSSFAGGGMDVGYLSFGKRNPRNNSITLNSCTFTENKAGFGGGGLSFYSSPYNKISNKIIFQNCNWTRNEAHNGAALDIAPQVWKSHIYDLKVEIIFRDCKFQSNHLTNNANKGNRSHKKGKGAFLAVGHRIKFEGSLVFDDNSDSALYLTSTEIEFKSNSSMEFTNNIGFEGGAIYILGFSTLILNDDVAFTFTNNSAIDAGGAIFQYTFDRRDFFSSQSCFITYSGEKNLTERNITFTFQNNTAGPNGRNSSKLGRYGHSIYATTINPCHNSRDCPVESFKDTFSCFANFIFEDESEYDISTAGKEITVDDEKLGKHNALWAIPGKLFKLPLESKNDLSNKISTVYHVSLSNINNSNASVDNAYTYMSNMDIRIYGKPGDRANLTLETISFRDVLLTVRVNVQQCPPGFNHDKKERKCVCSAYTNKRFSGIRSCDEVNFAAKLIPGYWMGYAHKTFKWMKFGKEWYLLHAICPRGQCLNENLKEKVPRSLPENTSLSALDKIICGSSRTGVLCSKCRGLEGYASHYHDDTYSCKKDNCKWGWLLYIVSEIVPVTLFFITVMVFDIKFTDGAINGFVLYAQITDTMLLRGNGFIWFPSHANAAMEAYRFFTRIFNLNFFAIDRLSFCLWKSATTLDLLAFKYITILYASTLVVIIIVILKYCHSTRVNNILLRVKGGSASSIKATIIHGISGFLVICYAECTRISLLLLTPVELYAGRESGNCVKHIVPFYNGELLFFRGKHLLYALPALLIVIILGILPPLMLLSYPLCYRVLSLLKISETRLAKILCICIPLEKFKPFFDSFQSSYKDEYRFFSGLYFFYRFTTLATFAFQSNLNIFYTLVQVQLAIILTFHAICQPYKKRSHNIIDTLLFMNLSAVNILTLYNYQLSQDLTDKQNHINVTSALQLTLLYLPLIYITAYSTKKMISKVRNKKIPSIYKFRSEKMPTTSELNAYHELSATFSLNAAENRLNDNIKF